MMKGRKIYCLFDKGFKKNDGKFSDEREDENHELTLKSDNKRDREQIPIERISVPKKT